ncbi:MAG: transcription termination factor Rho [Nocardioidaceae bacterium]|nr:transcription termination factor Rho [Nocardioidaceae bacterium]
MTQTSEATGSDAAASTAARTKKSGGLSSMLLPELKQLASGLGIKGAGSMRKSALVEAISAARGSGPDPAATAGRTGQSAPLPAREPAGGEHGWQSRSAAPQQARTSPVADAPVERQVVDELQATVESAEPATAPFSTNEMNGDFGATEGAAGHRGRDARRERPPRAEQSDRSRNRDRGRDSGARSDAGQDRDGGAVQTRDGQPGRDSRQHRDAQQDRDGEQGRDSGQQSRDGQQDRDSGFESGSGRERGNDTEQSRDHSGDQGQQGRDGGQRDSSNRDGYRDDDRSGTRNSRRRNRNRDRFRDRDKRRDTNDSEPLVSEDDVLIPAAGILDLLDNYAFVRTSGYLPGPNDVYVALSMVRKFGLRKGDAITGAVRQQAADGDRREKYNPMVRIDTVNGAEPETARNRIEFSKLVPLYAQERLRLETEPTTIATRIIDIVAPIGKGQRGLIVSPSKAGKTLILQAMANAITTNNPECHLMVVLVDERPEEVTDMQRAVKGEVIASTFDRPAEDHTTVAELAIERAKRLVELGHDVVVLLDSITRLGRAYNLAAPASGRILSGGVDSSALYPPKRFFGAARNIEDGGSLTILATALIETGSKMDEVIFEEFKGTGNMELRLRREYADKRIFPAIDVDASGTRREDLLMSKDELQIVWKLRRVLSALDGQQALELLLEKLRQTKSNVEFLMQVNKTTPTASGLRNSTDE